MWFMGTMSGAHGLICLQSTPTYRCSSYALLGITRTGHMHEGGPLPTPADCAGVEVVQWLSPICQHSPAGCLVPGSRGLTQHSVLAAASPWLEPSYALAISQTYHVDVTKPTDEFLPLPCLLCHLLPQDLVLGVDGSVNVKVYTTGYTQVGPARPSYPQHYGYPLLHDVSGEWHGCPAMFNVCLLLTERS